MLTMILHFCMFLQQSNPSIFEQSGNNINLTVTAYKPYWEIGSSGVQLFFVISGFLLSLPYIRALLKGQPLPSQRLFYKRRALRILPAYWLSLLIFIVFINPTTFGDILVHIFLIHNITLPTSYDINSPYWTLAIEAQYYILLPFIFKYIEQFLKRKNKKALVSFITLLLSCATLHALFIIVLSNLWDWRIAEVYFTWTNTFQNLTIFTCGGLVAWLYVTLELKILDPVLEIKLRKRLALISISGLGLGLVLFLLGNPELYRSELYKSLVPSDGGGVFWYLTGDLVLAFIYCSLLIGLVVCGFSWLRVLRWWPFYSVGIISYSVYIWHSVLYRDLIVPLLLPLAGSNAILSVILGLVSTLFIVFPVAWLSYAIAEQPFLRLRQKSH
jgi:peptidoglycan/LPS O-acetylase OafA/YrhL